MTELGEAHARERVDVPDRPGESFLLSWGAVSDIGRRRAHNEDSFLASAGIFAVADGMGGHAAGDVASAAVVTRLSELPEGFTTPQAVLDALRQATRDLADAADENGVGVGTTVTGAALTMHEGEPCWAVFNIGDSRVYLLEEDALSQVTVDHSVVQDMVRAGLIRAEDAETHPESNVITRAVGFNAEPMLDVWLVPVAAGSRLLICSDGLTREVDAAALRKYLSAGLSPFETAGALIDAALAAGGRDNITAVVVDVHE